MSATMTTRPRSRAAGGRGRTGGGLPLTRTEVGFKWGLRVVVLAIFGFLVIPIFIVVAESFNGADFLVFPLEGVSTKHYETFFNDPSWVDATITSARIALVAAVVSTVMGTLAAWALARSSFRGRSAVFALLYSPAIVPVIVLAIGYYRFFSDWHLVGSWFAVGIAYSAMTLPLVLVPVAAALQHLDQDLENAARSLGASPLRTLRYVTFPRIAAGIAAGAIFAFVSSFDESVIILFVGGQGSVTLTSKLWASVRDDLSPTMAVAGTVLIAVCIVLFLIAELITMLRERKATS